MSARSVENTNCYIDKTGMLEEGIKGFPSLFIEGAAASGKSVAVKMLISHHPEVEAVTFGMTNLCSWSREKQAKAADELVGLLEKRHSAAADSSAEDFRPLWVIFENVPAEMPKILLDAVVRYITWMPEELGDRAFLLSREEPQKELLSLFWKRRMEWIPQGFLRLRQRELADLNAMYGSPLRVREINRLTGGWAGCADVVMRLAAADAKMDNRKNNKKTAQDYIERYEVVEYIYSDILDTLQKREKNIIEIAAKYPWINKSFCEDIFGIMGTQEDIRRLERKGMLISFGKNHDRWSAVPMIRGAVYRRHLKDIGAMNTNRSKGINDKFISDEEKPLFIKISRWYEENYDLNHAGIILEKLRDAEETRAFIERNYSRISFYDFRLDGELFKGRRTPYNVFLKGIKSLIDKNLDEMHRQMSILRSMWNSDRKNSVMIQECYLNLAYADPAISLQEWLGTLEMIGSNILEEAGRKARIYDFLGYGISYLCGLRDLSGLFACKKKDENAYAEVWEKYLDEFSVYGYKMAKIEYYLETDRISEINDEINRYLMNREVLDDSFQSYRDLAAKWLLITRIGMTAEDVRLSEIGTEILDIVLREGDEFSGEAVQDMQNVFAFRSGHPEMLSYWLRDEKYELPEVNERSYGILFCKARGFFLLKQYDRAKTILTNLNRYLEETARYRVRAEVLFELGIIELQVGRKGEALQRIIESMILAREYRYVRLYASFGSEGEEAIELYSSWMERNAPGGFKRKKKYNYGSVLRMPDADYIDVLIRETRKTGRKNKEFQPVHRVAEEKLTVMETVILQDISRGLTNAEICEELNLKLSTVKSHLYSLYKKLGVQNRMSAVNKGKELGLVN